MSNIARAARHLGSLGMNTSTAAFQLTGNIRAALYRVAKGPNTGC